MVASKNKGEEEDLRAYLPETAERSPRTARDIEVRITAAFIARDIHPGSDQKRGHTKLLEDAEAIYNWLLNEEGDVEYATAEPALASWLTEEHLAELEDEDEEDEDY